MPRQVPNERIKDDLSYGLAEITNKLLDNLFKTSTKPDFESRFADQGIKRSEKNCQKPARGSKA